MILFAWVAFLFATHQIDALSIQNISTIAGHKPTHGNAKMVVLVMFDRTYEDLFQCFIRYFDKNFTRQIPLDVVVYDEESERYMLDFMDEHPGVVRELEAKTKHKECPLQLANNATNAAWSSKIYQAFYWSVILERLRRSEDVLHMDLDAIAVGDPLAPISNSNPNADITGPFHANSIDQQYVLYRSTSVVQSLILNFADVWDNWLKTDMNNCSNPLPAEQIAISKYLTKYNPGGWYKPSGGCTLCKIHTGETILLSNEPISSVGQEGMCKYPDECKQQGFQVIHGRNHILHYCSNKEADKAINHP